MTFREISRPWEYVKNRLDTMFRIRCYKFKDTSTYGKLPKNAYEYLWNQDTNPSNFKYCLNNFRFIVGLSTSVKPESYQYYHQMDDVKRTGWCCFKRDHKLKISGRLGELSPVKKQIKESDYYENAPGGDNSIEMECLELDPRVQDANDGLYV